MSYFFCLRRKKEGKNNNGDVDVDVDVDVNWSNGMISECNIIL